jgi:hypothetical protein
MASQGTCAGRERSTSTYANRGRRRAATSTSTTNTFRSNLHVGQCRQLPIWSPKTASAPPKVSFCRVEPAREQSGRLNGRPCSPWSQAHELREPHHCCK